MKTAVILLNLGAPDSLENVRPFLFNLFNDQAIIDLPQPFRRLLARLLSRRRNIKAQEIYKKIGGKSPLMKMTKLQAEALERELSDGYKVFICMRYWHPMSAEVAADVHQYEPDKIILLPLYPQYSTTTTGSSFKNFISNYNQLHLERGSESSLIGSPLYGGNDSIRLIESYHLHPDFLAAHIDLLKPHTDKFPQARVLFSAHGLPEKIIKKGDPYQKQIEETTAAVAAALNLKDWRVCYQSKVGPLPWLKPYTIDEIAAANGMDLIIVPIAFVSEHSETLVELDIDFKNLAVEAGVKNYIRIPALGAHPLFIKALVQLITNCHPVA